VTIFYCLRFETSLFVASYDSQGHGGGIGPRLHAGQKQKQKLTTGNQPALSHPASALAGTHGHIFVQCRDLCFVLFFFLSLILLIDKGGVGLFLYRLVFTFYTLLRLSLYYFSSAEVLLEYI
jgi:hypothetical protein